ncbi:inactive ubiquitin carboxyl-terminal hydrolase MINDY-4B-like [Lytechinus pictus]|uniref:inactive ubiquitin carboxyl-terminal hydrolase MINDY-4B-like n=1 Tax=Lytechinus pictus TaxID=7653 RepID=UPI0030BA0681
MSTGMTATKGGNQQPDLFKLAAALENATPNNLFASAARPKTSQEDFKITKTKEQVEEQDGKEAGDDITMETAEGIRDVLFGRRSFTIGDEWRRASFVRCPPDGPFPYGLLTPRDKARGLLIAIQAQFIQKILEGDGNQSTQDPARATGQIKVRKSLTAYAQRKQFISTLVTILWRAGECKKAIVVLHYPKYAALLYSQQKRLEHFIQEIKVIECVSEKQLYKLLDKKLGMFEDQVGGGPLMFLLSLILSRRISKLKDDLQGEYLWTDTDQCSLSLINLVLSGQATPYLFNGKQEYGLDSKPLDVPRYGIQKRAEIGILVVDRPEGKQVKNAKKITIGSMLKTPVFPVWVLRLKGRYSLFFCCNLNLNRDWRSEAKFNLYFYTGQTEQKEEVRLTVDSRLRLMEEKKKKDDKNIPLVDECIQSRWPGAHIDWNGTSPFF